MYTKSRLYVSTNAGARAVVDLLFLACLITRDTMLWMRDILAWTVRESSRFMDRDWVGAAATRLPGRKHVFLLLLPMMLSTRMLIGRLKRVGFVLSANRKNKYFMFCSVCKYK